MNFKNFLLELKASSTLKNLRELASELELPEDFWGEIHDRAVPWFNRNDPRVITKLLGEPKLVLGSKLLYWKDHLVGESNYQKPLGTVEDFKKSLDQEIVLWRGGAGTYDPEFIWPKHVSNRRWVSFTASKDRVKAFSLYDGTVARGFLSKNEQYWIIEARVPLGEVLFYLPGGNDEEVILSKQQAKNAKVIEQTEVNS